MASPASLVPAKWRTLIRRFRRDRRGATAMEFGFIAVPFLGLLAAIIETGLVFLNTTGLEAAVQEAGRNIMTGGAQGNGISSSATFLDKYVCNPTNRARILPSFIDCSQLIVDVRTASAFASADTSRGFYGSGYSRQFCPGAPGDIVVVRIAYPMPVFLPIIAGFTTIAPVTQGLVSDVPGNPGLKHLLIGTAVFRNEPYNGSTYTAPNGC